MTGANSTSPNENRLKEPLMVTMRLGVSKDNKPNSKGHVKK